MRERRNVHISPPQTNNDIDLRERFLLKLSCEGFLGSPAHKGAVLITLKSYHEPFD